MQFKFSINIIFLKTNSFTEQIYSDTAYIINYFFLIFFAMASAFVDSEFFFVHEYFWRQLRTHFVAQVSASVDTRKKKTTDQHRISKVFSWPWMHFVTISMSFCCQVSNLMSSLIFTIVTLFLFLQFGFQLIFFLA